MAARLDMNEKQKKQRRFNGMAGGYEGPPESRKHTIAYWPIFLADLAFKNTCSSANIVGTFYLPTEWT
jgi:hypothetical protein